MIYVECECDPDAAKQVLLLEELLFVFDVLCLFCGLWWAASEEHGI